MFKARYQGCQLFEQERYAFKWSGRESRRDLVASVVVGPVYDRVDLRIDRLDGGNGRVQHLDRRYLAAMDEVGKRQTI